MQGTHTDDNKRYSILFVDDEEKSLKYFNRFFGEEFRVITTDDPLEAERIIDREGEESARVMAIAVHPYISGTPFRI